MQKKRIYISGPISGLDLEKCAERFKQTQLMLEAQGYEVWNPMENGLPSDATTRMHMHRDLATLTNEEHPFDCIYMMSGWPHSAGCKLELDTAISIGLRVIFEEVGLIISFQ